MSTLGGVGGLQSGGRTISSSGRIALLQDGTLSEGSTSAHFMMGSLNCSFSICSLVGSLICLVISSSVGSLSLSTPLSLKYSLVRSVSHFPRTAARSAPGSWARFRSLSCTPGGARSGVLSREVRRSLSLSRSLSRSLPLSLSRSLSLSSLLRSLSRDLDRDLLLLGSPPLSRERGRSRDFLSSLSRLTSVMCSSPSAVMSPRLLVSILTK